MEEHVLDAARTGCEGTKGAVGFAHGVTDPDNASASPSRRGKTNSDLVNVVRVLGGTDAALEYQRA